MRKIELQAPASAQLLHRYPDLGGEIAQMHAVGALPHFRGRSPECPRPLGLHMTEQNRRNGWGDVERRQRRDGFYPHRLR